MEPFQKMVKHHQQKWYHFRQGPKIVNENGTILVSSKGSQFLNKNGTISEKGKNSSTKMVPFQKRVKHRQRKWYHFSQKRVKIPQQNWYHFRKVSKILSKMVPFQKMVKNTILGSKGSKFLNKNGTISEKGRKSSTRMVPFQNRVKSRQPKWYHFCQKMVKIPQQKWYYFRKGSGGGGGQGLFRWHI